MALNSQEMLDAYMDEFDTDSIVESLMDEGLSQAEAEAEAQEIEDQVEEQWDLVFSIIVDHFRSNAEIAAGIEVEDAQQEEIGTTRQSDPGQIE